MGRQASKLGKVVQPREMHTGMHGEVRPCVPPRTQALKSELRGRVR